MTLPGRHRGVPLWVHLAALVLVPLLGVGFLITLIVSRSAADAASAAESEAAVRAAGALATAAAAVDQEVLPTFTLAALQSPETAASLGAPAVFVDSAAGSARSALAGARSVTDAALAQAARQPTALRAVDAAERSLAQLRATIDLPSPDVRLLVVVYDAMGDVADGLATAQEDAVAAASAADLPATSGTAIRDVNLVAGLVRASSRQLPQFLGWTLSGNAGLPLGTQWPETRAAYEAAVARMGDLVDPALIAGWQAVAESPATMTLATTIEATRTPTTLSLLTMTGLATAAAERTVGTADLLDTAVAVAVDAAVADRRDADAERTTTIVGGVLIVLVSLGGMWWVGRSATRSLAAVATQAEQISLGALVDVPVSGPREMRTVSAVLGEAVGSLRRIQDQAAAVARGELEDPTLSQPLPGRLGQAVHASVQQLVASLQQRDRLQSELVHQAAHDSLTDLPNRAQAQRLTDAALARARRSGSIVGMLFVDLDGFKAVNDRAGHAAGDAVLRVVSARLADGVRTGDTVCRLGGDEFVALIEPVEDQTDLVALAERLVQAVAEDVVVTGPTGADVVVHVGASIGVAFCQDGELDGGALIAQADAAAYLAKARGKGRVEVFDDALRSQMATRHTTEAALRTALVEDELRLVYQPVVDVPSGRLTGFEALVRWHRGDTVVPPMEFVPVAEQSDLICDLDRWVLGTACRQLAAWRAEAPPAAGAPEPTLSVNLSGRHLADPRVVDHVLEALTASGVPAELLVLEVTETVLIDAPVALAQLARLRALGVGIAIDDFGTGYTSIGQLGSMPVDTLKIDRSFVASDDPGQRSLVALMIQAAHTIGMTVVAEGVELPDHLTTLRAERCDRAQGYLMARPLPPEDAFACYRSGRSDATADRTPLPV